jgi:BMFP domain-containing protein YqiC
MLTKSPLDHLTQQLLDAIPSGIRALPTELEKQFHEILQAAFAKMNLVTREEFDAQVRVLQRTREKLTALEKSLAEHQKPIEK